MRARKTVAPIGGCFFKITLLHLFLLICPMLNLCSRGSAHKIRTRDGNTAPKNSEYTDFQGTITPCCLFPINVGLGSSVS